MLILHKRTKALRFDNETIQTIINRDEYCIFCNMAYHLPEHLDYAQGIFDIMHIVPKSQGGLGVEENGVLGCRYHHQMLDNGNEGLRDEMMKIIDNYMELKYPGWDRSVLVYQKY